MFITIFDENVDFISDGGGGGGTDMRLSFRCKSNCVFSVELIFVSPGDCAELALDIVVVAPSFEVVLSIWLSSELGIGMSTKHTESLIPFDVCASQIFSVLGAASTKIYYSSIQNQIKS